MSILKGTAALLSACIAILGSITANVAAQTYPARPVRVLIPLPPGSPAEIPARAMSDALAKVLGQAFVVENRPGADGFIVAEACARAAPDGYTLCGMSQSQLVLNPFFHNKMPYDPERDFAPIGYLGTFSGAMTVSTRLPVNTLREFVEYAKAKPEAVSWATLGGTSMGPLFTGWLKQNTAASFHQIPYKSTLEGLQAVIAGDVDAVVIAIGPVITPFKAGRIKVLAVTGASRWPALPDVPTMKEAGVDMPTSFNTWLGMFAPAATPPEIVARLNAEMARIMVDPAFKARFITNTGLDADDYARATPAEFAAFIRNDREVLARAAAAAGIKKR